MIHFLMRAGETERVVTREARELIKALIPLKELDVAFFEFMGRYRQPKIRAEASPRGAFERRPELRSPVIPRVDIDRVLWPKLEHGVAVPAPDE